MKKMKIHTWDTVRIIAGKNRFRVETDKDGVEKRTPIEAKVLRTFPQDDKLVVEGVNIVTKHVKKQGTTPGQKIQFEKPIHISNVMLIDPQQKNQPEFVSSKELALLASLSKQVKPFNFQHFKLKTQN
jgi:large subunit ribosomal protein L24